MGLEFRLLVQLKHQDQTLAQQSAKTKIDEAASELAAVFNSGPRGGDADA